MRTDGTRRRAWGVSLLCAFVLGLSAPCEAAATWQVSTIKWVYPLSDGSFILVLVTDPPTCPAAGTPKYLTVIAGQNGVSAEGLKNMLASSLTALATGAQVQVNFDDATTNCYVNRLIVFAP